MASGSSLVGSSIADGTAVPGRGRRAHWNFPAGSGVHPVPEAQPDAKRIRSRNVSESDSRRTRREMIREYKETPRPMGVFRVRNTANSRMLVGSSTDLPSILNRHRAQLRLGAHRNRDLQADWNALGADAFEFEILDEIERRDEPGYDPAEDLRALEAMWLERLDLPAGSSY